MKPDADFFKRSCGQHRGNNQGQKRCKKHPDFPSSIDVKKMGITSRLQLSWELWVKNLSPKSNKTQYPTTAHLCPLTRGGVVDKIQRNTLFQPKYWAEPAPFSPDGPAADSFPKLKTALCSKKKERSGTPGTFFNHFPVTKNFGTLR